MQYACGSGCDVYPIFDCLQMMRVTWDSPSHVSSMYIRGYNIYIQHEGEERIDQRYVSRNEDTQFVFGETPC